MTGSWGCDLPAFLKCGPYSWQAGSGFSAWYYAPSSLRVFGP